MFRSNDTKQIAMYDSYLSLPPHIQKLIEKSWQRTSLTSFSHHQRRAAGDLRPFCLNQEIIALCMRLGMARLRAFRIEVQGVYPWPGWF